MSPAASNTFLPSLVYLLANLPIVVVFPTPFTPTISIILGPGSIFNLESSSPSIFSIKVFNSSLTSSGLVNPSDFIASLRLSIISIVVFTPTSAVINISSNSSNKSSSIVVYEFNTASILSVIPCLAFVSPDFSLLNKLTFSSITSSAISKLDSITSSISSLFSSTISSVVSSTSVSVTFSFSSDFTSYCISSSSVEDNLKSTASTTFSSVSRFSTSSTDCATSST